MKATRGRLGVAIALRAPIAAAVVGPLVVAAVVVAAAVVPAGSARAAEGLEPAASPSSDEAIARARKAARAGDYATALRHYQEALRLRPSAKVHFNIAVCHHRLMLGHAAGSPAYEEERAAAVDAYNRYLQAAPGAPDTEEVAELVRALGGTPLSDDPEPWTIELVEPDAVPEAPSLVESGGPSDPTTTPATGTPTTSASAPASPPATVRPVDPAASLRGRVGPFIPLVMSNPRQLAANDELRPVPTLGLGVRGNAFLGQRRRLALGGELALTTQPTSAEARHRLSLGWLGVLLEIRHPLGDAGRFEIGGGGVVGLGWQSLVYTGDAPLRCAATDREASRRAGLWTGARLSLAALLGKRRNHELSLRVGPGLQAHGAGSVATSDAEDMPCTGEPSAFETFGLPDGAALSVTVDIGYAPRF